MPDLLANNLFGQTVSIAHDAATKEYTKGDEKIHWVDPSMVEIFEGMKRDAQARDRRGSASILDKIAGTISNLLGLPNGNKTVLDVSRLAALDTIVANAANVVQRSASLPTPEEQITIFLGNYFDAPGALTDEQKANSSEMSDDEIDALILDNKVNALSGVLDKLLLSLVHTPHPTIYHGKDARLFEADLTKILENPDYHNDVGNRTDPIRLNDAGKAAVAKLFNGKDSFIEKLVEGAAIPPKQQTTVSLETIAEKANMEIIQGQLASIIATWNKVVGEIEIEGLTSEHRKKLSISPAREREMVELSTWGQSADADGREKSTSQYLYECIQNNLNEAPADIPDYIRATQGTDTSKIYDGLSLDLRQNAGIHLPFMSALFQIKFRNSKAGRYRNGDENGGTSFAKYCDEFMKAHEKNYIGDSRWNGPSESIFQQLKEEDRADFMTGVIEHGYRLIPKQMGVDTKAFTTGEDTTEVTPGSVDDNSDNDLKSDAGIPAIKQVFLKRYEKEIKAAGFEPETIEYKEMIKVAIPFDSGKPDGTKVSLRGAWDAVVKLNGWEILHNGKQYSRLAGVPKPERPRMDFWNYVNPEQILVQNFLQGTKTLSTDGKFVELNTDERSIFTDTAKRLFVAHDALEKYGPKVATRYQIANFSEPADFLILLKLFQDTGIAEIENNKVVSSKLAIQPLLETGEDLDKADAIFKKLLGNPNDATPTLAKSFWQARGNVAEFMIGHSDGGASVGNFASQWKIYRTARELHKLFKEHGIEAKFFHGVGRGIDRGGSIDPRLQMEQMSPEEMQSGRFDVTVQSDQPMDMAASDAFGKDYLTKMLIGTLDHTIRAIKHLAPGGKGEDAEAEKKREQMEADMEHIAERSREIYEGLVRNNKDGEVLEFYANSPDNAFKTSRAASRAGNQTFDKVRAIPKEYIANCNDLPLHNIGLKVALEEFKKEFGEKRLKDLNGHPFFKSEINLIRAGMAHYDPVVARANAKAADNWVRLQQENKETKKEPKMEIFVEKAIKELDGLDTLLDEIRGVKPSPRPVSVSDGLDLIGHAIHSALVDSGKPPRPNLNTDPTAWETIQNSLFTVAQEVGHRILPYYIEKPESRMAWDCGEPQSAAR